jgi:hypothetical protein
VKSYLNAYTYINGHHACTINAINDASMSINDAYQSVIDDSRVTLQIVASLTIIIYNRNMFIVKATGTGFDSTI